MYEVMGGVLSVLLPGWKMDDALELEILVQF